MSPMCIIGKRQKEPLRFPQGLRVYFLSAWRKRVIAVAIALANATVTSVNEKLGLLMLGNLLRRSDRIRLVIEITSRASISFTTDIPATLAIGHNVLILRHCITPFVDLTLTKTVDLGQ